VATIVFQNSWARESRLGEAVHVVRHRKRPGEGWGEHCHDHAEVFWVESGGGIHRVDGIDHALRAGDVWCMRPEHVHSARAGRLGLTIVNISFPHQSVSDLAQRHQRFWPWRNDALPNAHLSPPRMERLHAWADELATRQHQLDLDGFLLDLIRLMSEATAGDNPLPPWLRDALEAFRDPRHLVAGTARLAQLCDKSDDHLNRVVRRYRGCTTTELVTHMRIDHAATALRLSEQPISTIATTIGMPNLGHFYRRFHARFGTTPKRYRTSARQVVSGRQSFPDG